ncbi:MAG: tripartite tricarboxylate transporter TctB family protein [Pseudoclavibacter sp.]
MTTNTANTADTAPSGGTGIFRRLRGRLADVGMAVVSIAIAVVLLIGAMTMDVRGQEAPGPQFFPLIVSGLLFVIGVVLLVMQLRRPKNEGADWHRPDVSEDMLRDFGANTELIKVDKRLGKAAKPAGRASVTNAANATAASGAIAGPDAAVDSATPAAATKSAASGDDADTAHPIDWRTVGITAGAVALFALALEFTGWIIAATAMFWLIAYAFGAKRPFINLGIALLMASVIQLLFVGALGLSLPAGFVGVLF